MQKVSIQGYKGSFHQIAAENYLGKDVEVIPCATFSEVIKIAANAKKSDGGFMAIENSIAGSILPNYALLQKSNLKIAGEIYLHINQNLMVNPGVKPEDIREVHSHPMALLQCIEYLEKHPHWKLVETEDTALSAKYIHQHNHKHAAAIAGKLAAELFGLKIIAPKIQTNKNNYTRFLFLQRQDVAGTAGDANKASVSFQTDHSKGALVKVLAKISEASINLSKLQSMPIPTEEWQYRFHADMEFGSLNEFENAINEMKKVTCELRIFGVYKKGETVL
ncbi:MAG TPA: prephenate dehydratase [Panacibacter sp.]|nr:prephenate dehydratase [Panacibacter sp.]